MTEREKMDKQMLYDANNDMTILQERTSGLEMCYDYNMIRPSKELEQRTQLEKMFGKLGIDSCIVAPFWCDYGYNIEIGNKFYANHGCVILDGAKVRFGNHVFIGPYCGFYTSGHPIDSERRNKGLEYAYPITVGNNVWFGASVHVMPGVTIGNDVVIASGSIVKKDIPDRVVAGGNPCKVIRSITEQDKTRSYDP